MLSATQLRQSVSAAAAVMFALAGCAGMSEQACLTSDWRTVGFEDGSLGRSEATIGNYRKQCAEHGVAPDLDAIVPGHADGVRSTAAPATASKWDTAARRIKASAPRISRRISSPSTTRAGICTISSGRCSASTRRSRATTASKRTSAGSSRQIGVIDDRERHDDRAAPADGVALRGARQPLRRAHRADQVARRRARRASEIELRDFQQTLASRF